MNSSDKEPGKWHEPLLRLLWGAIELFSHGAMLALILLVIKGIESWMKRLWGTEKLLFGLLPVRYVFDGADLVLLVTFLTIGIYVILSAYYRKRGK
jgi:hypothetical protein